MRVCFARLQTEAIQKLSLTKIRDNDNEKVLIAALIAGLAFRYSGQTVVLRPKRPIRRSDRWMLITRLSARRHGGAM